MTTGWDGYLQRALDLYLVRGRSGFYLWSHQLWAIHLHDAINASASVRFREWHVALGRFTLKFLLQTSAGERSGAC